MEDHTKLENALINREIIRDIRNSVHPSIHATLKISIMKVTDGGQIHDSYVDRKITEFQIARNQKTQKRNFLERVKT